MKRDSGHFLKFKTVPICIACLALLALKPPRVEAFALLGPYADWMTPNYRDIGGAVDVDEEYRWNVPVVSYAFDQSFIDFFGSNGVAAVEAAIQTLNDLPSASETALTNFPLNTASVNYGAEQKNCFDLKSITLQLLLAQMGLAPSVQSIFVLRTWDPIFLTSPEEAFWPQGTIPNLIDERSFDPSTLSPTHVINETLYTGMVQTSDPGHGYVLNYPVNPMAAPATPVADSTVYWVSSMVVLPVMTWAGFGFY